MLVYFIRRLGQAVLVVAVMATIVFVSIFMIGNPVDVLANPNADQKEMAEIAARLGCARRTVARRLDLIRKVWEAEDPDRVASRDAAL